MKPYLVISYGGKIMSDSATGTDVPNTQPPIATKFVRFRQLGGVDFCHYLSPHFLDIYPDPRALTVVWANVSASSPSDPHQPGTCVVSSLWYLAGVHPPGMWRGLGDCER